MTTSEAVETKPLWLSIEEKFLADADALSGDTEASIRKIAGELDEAGYNVSNLGGNMLQLRWAMDEMRSVGRPLMKDVTEAVGALTLEGVEAPYAAVDKIISDISAAWPKLKNAQYRVAVARMVEETKLQLLVAKARGMEGDAGIRMLLEEKVEEEMITASLEITQEQLDQVKEAIKKELAERSRVETLLEKVADKADDERVRHLIENDVAEALILEMAQVDQSVIDGVNKAMEEELKEKQRLAEEEAARKKAEAEGPSLGNIPKEELLDYIESVREILEFSDVEKEIRVMCEQSSIPKALVDIAVSDPDKLDALESGEDVSASAPAPAPEKAEAQGPSLDEIPKDELLGHIEGVREILEFSDQEKEIRVMCEQSAIPKALVDIAVSDPDKLDELEKAAEG